ncbi:transcriptional regulator [Paractinoplanes deccanensis]|uniref:Transcriptional regulator n=1 Tax=Paractinoplanes deccanensis TaxID=113561 RepID=A0ABQ3Y5A1_9ACTN|nr:AraC family transcriptional regulator [Actinoplanes deccanensis]GID75163.1 transcriptional regulator [Actinoplanes deccanensis]
MKFGDYQTAITRTFVPLTAAPLGTAPFRATLRPAGDGDLRVTTVAATPHRVRRTDDTAEAYALATIQVSGHSEVRQDGRTARLGPGDLVFCDSTRPFGFTFPDPFEQVVVQVPRRLVGETALRRATAVPLDGAGPVAAFFRALAPAVPARYVPHGIGLLSEALTLAAGSTPAPGELARERVREHLRRSFRDPGLDADAVAHACHLSRRALFRLFADEPESFAGELRRVRVTEAGRLLRLHPHRAVAELAADCGFGGETQLRRAFQAVTGMTPGAYRAARAGS